jgi:hypothetical protein
MKNSVIAGGLMIVPLLIAAAIAYWPSRPAERSVTQVFVLATVQGPNDVDNLADELSRTIAQALEHAGVAVTIGQKGSDAAQGAALLLTAMTVDAGIFQLDLQLIEPSTGRVLWKNSYQSPRDSYREMLKVAGNALVRAINQ